MGDMSEQDHEEWNDAQPVLLERPYHEELHQQRRIVGRSPTSAQGSRSQNNSPVLAAPSPASAFAHVAPKRLFSGPSGTGSSGGLPSSSATSSAAHAAASSDCGAEFTRSLDDIAIRTMAKLDNKTEGSIKLNIPNVSNLKAKVNTSYHCIANLPWRLAAKTECTKRTSHLRFFSVYIDCNPESESTLWSCDAVVEFRLHSQRPDSTPHFSRQEDRHIAHSSVLEQVQYNSNNWGFPSFMEWGEVLNPEKGFIKGDRLVVEAKITVQKVVGVRKNPRFDFLNSLMHLSDAVLLIDGVKLYVSKAYLSLYSPVFHAMFFSKFSEREKQEIPVEDVILNEFIELLEVVYPSHKPISNDNVEFLLELGDKFEIQYVVDQCELFLMENDEFTVVAKLVWADQYCLAKLQDACVRTLKTVSDIKSLKTTDEYKNLSDTTKAALLEKIFKILKD